MKHFVNGIKLIMGMELPLTAKNFTSIWIDDMADIAPVGGVM